MLKTASQIFFNEFCKIFKNTFFTEHLRAGASDILLDIKTFNPSRCVHFRKLCRNKNLFENKNVIFSFCLGLGFHNFFHLIDIVGTLYLMSENVDFSFSWSIKFDKHKPLLIFSILPFYNWVIIRTILARKNVVTYLWTFKQQITLPMVFLKHSSLNSNMFFNPVFIPCFPESMFIQGPGFSEFSLFRIQVFQDPGPRYRSGSEPRF